MHVSRTVGRLLGSFLLFGTLTVARAEAAGVVGTGTPASCTQAAFTAALAGGGTVTFNCGAGAVIPITSTKTVTNTTTIDGTGQNITLDGGGTTRLFNTTYQFASFTLTFRALTLRNGLAADFGGAIRLAYQDFLTTLVVENVTFSNNVCSQAGNDVGGGALYAQGGIVTIRNSTFVGNRGGNGGAIGNLQARFTIEDTLFQGNTTNANVGGGGTGGAIYVDGSNHGQLVLRRTTFRSNTAAFMGGAIHTYMYAGASGMTIEDSLFENNVTDRNGGAIYHQNGSLAIARSTFSGNITRGQGGALWLLEATPTTITNSTFTGNRANGIPPNNGSSGLGGAILINASTVATITHSTIANNHADWVGGGITGGMSGGSSTTLRGTLVAHNTAANGGNPWNIAHNCSNLLLDAGGNMQFPPRQNPGDPNDVNCTAVIAIADPLLLPLASNGGFTPTRALPAGSPARNVVTSGCPPPSTDQRGVARPAGACDVGAYEANPTVSAGNVSAPEGTGGAASAVFPVTLSEASALAVTVTYSTQNGTAQPGADYVTTSGTLTFAPGITALAVTVPLVTDAIDEDDESFALSLSNAVNAVASATPGVATIVDDDGPPQVSVTDCGEFEDSSGPGACLGSVSLSAGSGKTVTVAFATQNVTATAPGDYTAISGVLTFPPGTLQRPLSVPFVPDSVDEQDETFSIGLTAPVNATLGDAQGIGTIFDDDGPVLSTAQPQVLEGNAGTTDATFAFSLSGPSVQSIVVVYATGDLTAVAGVDYQARTGALTFAPGSTQPILVPVPVIGDIVDEPDERFSLFIAVDNASAPSPALTATIRDDDRGAFPLEELAHGAERRRRPGADGTSLHVLALPAFTSWEVVLDESSGDLSSGAAGPALERLSPNLVDVLQASVPAGVGYARSLRLRNGTSVAIESYARVRSTSCTTDCGADDVYRLRAYETTLRIPRFNTAAGQSTALVVQNLGTSPMAASALFWRADGFLAGAQSFTVPARGLFVLNAASVGAVAGTSGSVTITHDGRHGDLVGKAVSVDPGPGFAFDTPFLARPR